jgi:hypothetical protein
MRHIDCTLVCSYLATFISSAYAHRNRSSEWRETASPVFRQGVTKKTAPVRLDEGRNSRGFERYSGAKGKRSRTPRERRAPFHTASGKNTPLTGEYLEENPFAGQVRRHIWSPDE